MGAAKIVFALEVRPKTEPQAIQMEKKRLKTLKIKKSDENGAKRAPKGSQRSEKVAKWSQKGAKWSPKRPKWSPKGAKREPKGNQSASKSRLGRQGRFWEPKGVNPGRRIGTVLVHFWSKKLKKTTSKNHLKFDTEKVEKMREKTLKMETKREPKSVKNWKSDFMKMLVFL